MMPRLRQLKEHLRPLPGFVGSGDVIVVVGGGSDGISGSGGEINGDGGDERGGGPAAPGAAGAGPGSAATAARMSGAVMLLPRSSRRR